MFPLRDNVPSRTTPVVNYLMIAICSVVFFLQIDQQPGVLGRKRKLKPKVDQISPDSERVVYSQVSPWGRRPN